MDVTENLATKTQQMRIGTNKSFVSTTREEYISSTSPRDPHGGVEHLFVAPPAL
jgi:hypothetical protein